MNKNFLCLAVFVFISVFGIGQTVVTPPQAKDSSVVINSEVAIENDTTIFNFAEVMPDFLPRGSFYRYLASNIKYPEPELKNKIQGTVYVSFIIEKDGSVSNVKLVKGVQGAPGFSDEAIRVIKEMPKWKPGEMNGHVVRVILYQPVTFQLNSKKSKH